MKYYNINPLLKKDCYYNFIWGGRSNGKSYAIKKHLIKEFTQKHRLFVLITRNSLIKYNMTTNYFNDVTDKINYKNGAFYFNNTLIGYSIPLTLQDTYKSKVFDGVYNTVFEEFSAFNSYEYLTNEVELFQSLISTIYRQRTGKIFFIGNNISISNPYFELFDIDILRDGITKGTIKTYKRPGAASVALEWCDLPYENEKEIPILQRTPNNLIAVSGEMNKQKDVLENFTICIDDKGCIIFLSSDNQKIICFYYIKVPEGLLFLNRSFYKCKNIIGFIPFNQHYITDAINPNYIKQGDYNLFKNLDFLYFIDEKSKYTYYKYFK